MGTHVGAVAILSKNLDLDKQAIPELREEVDLADSAAMLTRREASTPRLRLGVLASLLVNIALKLHSVPLPLTPLQC